MYSKTNLFNMYTMIFYFTFLLFLLLNANSAEPTSYLITATPISSVFYDCLNLPQTIYVSSFTTIGFPVLVVYTATNMPACVTFN